MSKKNQKTVYVSGEDVFKYLDSNFNIKIPDEFKQGNWDHKIADVQRIDLQMSGIRKGFQFSEKDYFTLSTKLSVLGRVEDVIDLSHYWELQQSLPKELFDIYDKEIEFRTMVDNKDLNGVKTYLDSFYHQKFGKMTDDILERDSMFIIDETQKDKNRNDIIDSLL